MPRQRLSGIDTAWYRLDQPADPADILGVLIFDGQIDYARLVATLETRFLRFDRFRQRVNDRGMGRPRWQEDPNFALANHLQRIELAEPADTDVLQKQIGEFMNHELDPDRPLWRMWLAENFQKDGQSASALIFQMHHCLGDGFALAHMLLGLADKEPDAPWPAWVDSRSFEPEHAKGNHQWVGQRVLGELGELAQHPSREMGKVASGVKTARRAAAALGHLLSMPFDPPTPLKRDPVGRRRVSWSQGVDLDRVKTVAHKAGGTVNDVLMAALTGAWRRYLKERGEAVDDFDIRALVPVNLRPQRRIEDVPDELGNHFGLVFLDLPISKASARERLLTVHARMNALKHSPQPYLLYGVLKMAGHIPERAEHGVANLFGKKASTVVTNVPGPREPLYLGGQRLTDIMFWAPHPAKLGSNASIISYAGNVRVGVRGDENVLADPETVVRYFDEEFGVLEGECC